MIIFNEAKYVYDASYLLYGLFDSRVGFSVYVFSYWYTNVITYFCTKNDESTYKTGQPLYQRKLHLLIIVILDKITFTSGLPLCTMQY
jgi:hypothetical protein